MTQLLTAAQMRGIEAAAMASGAVTGQVLMERAGAGVVAEALAWLGPRAAPGSAAILCGPGNNGGDGFVVARLLAARGWGVEVHAWGDPARRPPDAAAAAAAWDGVVHPWDPDRVARIAGDLIVDALFGGGLTRALPPEIIGPLTDLYVRGGSVERMVAIDGPSGLCLDSGRSLTPGEDAVYAGLTVTFHRPRLGHVLADGPDYCGTLRVVDIGLDTGPSAVPGDAVRRVAPPAPARLRKWGRGHKFDHGHALVLGGGVGRGGAARLAARAALRVGAGLVTLGTPPAALQENACRLDAVMLRAVRDGAALGALLTDRRIGAVCLGPGLGSGPGVEGLVAAALGAGRACVLDADALDPAILPRLHADCVLTPHGGEFTRLFPDIAARLAAPPDSGPAMSRVDAAREAAARAGAVVLLKGPDTVIAAPGGAVAVHAAVYGDAAPWLATAGSGDVLAGLIAGLLARGLAPMEAAETAAWLHAAAARAFGPGLIAEDLPDALPGVLRGLGA